MKHIFGLFAYDKEVIPYLEDDINIDKGIYVVAISKDGPCYNTDLQEADIIIKIDNVELNKLTDLRRYVYTKQPADEVILTILRRNREIKLAIRLGRK